MDTSAPPVLQMLWEPNDPAEVMRRRFGFGSEAAAAGWVGALLRSHWGREVTACERIVMSDMNALAWVRVGSTRMIAKWSPVTERFARLDALAELNAWLAERGVPVSAPVPALDGSRQVRAEGVSIGVQHEVPGSLLDVDDLEQVSAVGRALARLHGELRDYRGAATALATEPAPLSSRLAGWLEAAQPHLDPAAIAALRRCGGFTDGELGMQLVHGDVRAANVICRDRDVAAFLDFEEARIDQRVVELARTAVLLGTRFHDWGPVDSATHAALRAGYESVAALTPSERQWWPALLLWTTLSFVPPGHDSTGWAASAAELRERLLTHLE